METHSIPNEQRSGLLWRLWPFWLYVVVVFVFDLACSPMILRGNMLLSWMRDYAIALVVGSMVGQACFACLIGGLAGRTWLSGYVFAVILASMGVYLCLMGEELDSYFRYHRGEISLSRIPAPLLLVPAFVLAGAAPLLVFRGSFGWRLTRTIEQEYKPRSWGVEELLIGTAITGACLIVATSAAQIAQVPTFQFLLPLGVFSCIVAAASLFGVAPAVWLSFRTTSWLRRFSLMGLFVGIVVLLTISISILVNAIIVGLSSPEGLTSGRRFPVLTDIIFYSAAISIVSAIVFLTGLATLILSGYRLFQSIPNSVASTKRLNTNPYPLIDDDASNEGQIGYNVFVHRAIAGLILGIALIVSISTSNLVQSRAIGLTEFQNLAMKLGEKGVLRLNAKNEPVEIKVSPDASLDDLSKNVSLRQIRSLSLANCRFEDDDVPKLSQFTALYSLDLEGTQITDIGLLKLADRTQPIFRIGLARTKVTRLGLQRYIEKAKLVNHLDLRETVFDCDQLSEMTVIDRIHGLRLGKAQVDNAGLAKLLAVAKFDELDLTDCEIDETPFQNSRSCNYYKLVLDGTRVTDVPFSTLLSSLNCIKLSINRTAITDNVLPGLALATGVYGLELSETQITEEGLSTAQIQHLTQLSLNGKQFTGECFSTWYPSSLKHLDLSNSGVTDLTLAHVASLPALLTLNLANTDITDAGLALIAKTKTKHIDLRGTKVTTSGLCDSKISGWQIFLDINQFTPEEVRRIRSNATVVLGQEFPW